MKVRDSLKAWVAFEFLPWTAPPPGVDEGIVPTRKWVAFLQLLAMVPGGPC